MIAQLLFLDSEEPEKDIMLYINSPGGHVSAGLAKGDLKFKLDGYKLKGSWVLVRTKSWGGGSADGRSWLLIKHRDEWSGNLDITEFAPLSGLFSHTRTPIQISYSTLESVAHYAGSTPKKALARGPTPHKRATG